MQKIEDFRRIVLRKLEVDNADNKYLIELVERARVSNRWGVGETVQIMSKTNSLAHFATMIFHEAGHKILDVGSTPKEEEMCHGFSRDTCTRLNLPYDEELTDVCRKFLKLSNEHSGDPEIFIREIDLFSEEHKLLLSLQPSL